MELAVWREGRLAAAAECRKNDKGLDDGLHWLMWLYCHKREKGRLKPELAPKSWTLIKAYSGALCKLGSVCDRTQLFQFQTATLPVVVIHIVIYLFHQFVHRQFTCVIETLCLQHRKETLHRCIVPKIRLSRHALNHGMLGKQFPIPRRTVQHALVRMKHCSFISQPGAAFSSISFTISLSALRLMA